MKVVELESNREEKFWLHVNAAPVEHYFFIYDKKLNPIDTEILLALENERIEGMMLIFKRELFQARGSRDAVAALLDHLDIERAEGSVPLDCRDILLARYEAPLEYEIVLMHLDRGNEKPHRQHNVIRLRENQAAEVTKLLVDANPEWWGETREENIRKSLGLAFWLGVMAGDRIACVGNTRVLDFGSNIGVVATHKDFRNKGYATSVVSSLVDEIFRRYEKALIHVLSDNRSAMRVYEKVGFRKFNSYFQIKYGQRVAHR